MAIWALVPVKHLGEAKSSLSKVLSPAQRQKLVLAMLTDVLSAFRGAGSISGSAVVSPDKNVLDFARSQGAVGVLEKGLGLNGALKFGIERLSHSGATTVLIAPGDIPLMRCDDVENMTSMATLERDVVIAPSKANGTNALLLRPPDIMDLKFGGESFPLHLAEAVKAGTKPRIYRSPTVAFDIDEPVDLLKVETLGLGTKTHDFLTSLKE
jgi:2-phospho-L-lactate guanylyltransferase